MQAAASTSSTTQFGEQWVGQSLDGRFPLYRYLGGSDTSAVFLTQIGSDPDAKAVIKLVLASSCDSDAQLGLWRRAGKLSHPNLIRILDGGRCWLAGNELIFLVSEYAEENLGEVVPGRALTAHEGEALLRPILAVLKYVHHQGLVHGRLRPSNVMAAQEQLKISSDSIRPAGEIKGLVQASVYDAPELKHGKISSASDVWSLGAILAEGLTGKTAVQSGAHKALPKPFAEIVRHCLREDPASRWTLSQVETFLQGNVAEARHEAGSSEIGSNVRRYLPLILGGVLLLILAAIYGLIHGGSRHVQTAGGKAATPAVSSSTPVSTPTVTRENNSGGVLQEVSPSASENALKTIHGRIKVRVGVEVDSAGNVTATKLITAGPSKYFSRLALQAAQQWKFQAPKQNGLAVPSQWTILFEYTHNGILQQASVAR
jgi:TonB family protein